MSKETYYFSHDYNARSDVKIKKLIMKHGYCGYGIYWSIIEDLYQNNNEMNFDIDLLSFEYRADEGLIKSILTEFDLFVIDNNCFGSKSIQNRLNDRNEKSNKAKTSASHRWNDGNSDNRLKAENCLIYCIKIYDDNEQFLKIGITTESVSRRYSGKLKNYKYDLMFTCENTVENCLFLEREINKTFNSYTPKEQFAGYLECIELIEYDRIKDFALQHDKFRNANFNFRNAIKERKGKETKVNKLEARKQIFINELSGFKDKYSKELLNAFFKYWTELNPSKTKMRFELEKTFEVSKRLSTWAAREKVKPEQAQTKYRDL